MAELLSFNNLQAVLEEYGQMVLDNYKDSLMQNGHMATGNLINNARYIVETGDKSVEVSLVLQDYWKYLENDTKPHWPPKNKILEWIRVKPVIPSKTYNGKLPTEEQLAFLIGRAMAGLSPNQSECKNPNGGTTGTKDLKQTLDDVNNRFEKLIGEAIAKDIDASLTTIWMEFYK